MRGSYLGPGYVQDDIEQRLTQVKARFRRVSDDELVDAVAKALADGKAVGWHQGRMEFGPRALGNRSILGDARSPAMQKVLNLKVKYRESFRPFAPAVLREDVSDWFEIATDSPYMLLVANVRSEHCVEMSGRRAGAFWHRQAQHRPFVDPGRDPRRPIRPASRRCTGRPTRASTISSRVSRR